MIEDKKLIDAPHSDMEKRWVVVAPPGGRECRLLISKASGDSQITALGNQAGGRVCLFMHTNDFCRDYDTYRARGVIFTSEPPRDEAYGTVAVFKDPYGNLWDLIDPYGSGNIL